MARGQRLPELKVLPPEVVSISADQHQAAVAALAGQVRLMGPTDCRLMIRGQSPVKVEGDA
jgi:hypothetical protein